MKIQPTMTPERLAECTHELWVGCPTYCANCRTELSDYLAAQRAHIRDLEAQVREAREDREFLWDRLDDIDSLDDMAKDDDKAFRVHARKLQQMRFERATSDGYNLTWKRAALGGEGGK